VQLQAAEGLRPGALLFQTQGDSHELLRYLLDALGLDRRGQDLVQSPRVERFLYPKRWRAGGVAVFIDEAEPFRTVLETVVCLPTLRRQTGTTRCPCRVSRTLARLMRPGLAQCVNAFPGVAGLERLPAQRLSLRQSPAPGGRIRRP